MRKRVRVLMRIDTQQTIYRSVYLSICLPACLYLCMPLHFTPLRVNWLYMWMCIVYTIRHCIYIVLRCSGFHWHPLTHSAQCTYTLFSISSWFYLDCLNSLFGLVLSYFVFVPLCFLLSRGAHIVFQSQKKEVERRMEIMFDGTWSESQRENNDNNHKLSTEWMKKWQMNYVKWFSII